MSVKIDANGINYTKTPNIAIRDKELDRSTVKEFEDLLKKESKEKKGENKSGSEGSFSELSSIFSKLLSGNNDFADIKKAEGAGALAIDFDDLQKLSDSLVNKILVGNKDLNGTDEIRLLLNDSSILKSTEISLKRDLTGMLFVAISTSDNNSYQRLLSSKTLLEKKLDESEKNSFRVDIVYNDKDNKDNGEY